MIELSQADLWAESSVTRPPPLSPLHTSPVRAGAQRLTVFETRGAGQARLETSSNSWLHSDCSSNLNSLCTEISLTALLSL